jgi:hypothetical protein
VKITTFQKALHTFVIGGFIPIHGSGDITQPRRAAFQNAIENPGSFPGLGWIIK